MDINELAGMVMAQEAFQPAQETHLSVYQVNRCYGGPEEGGWWYDHLTFKGSMTFPSVEEAESWKTEAEKQLPEKVAYAGAYNSLGDESSSYYPEGYIPTGWSDGESYWVVIEETPGEMHTRHVPHYE